MASPLYDFIRTTTALLAGGVIGLAFGTLQTAALRRNEKKQRSGQFNNGWTLIPGAGARVGYLLVALALVQFVCPMLFSDGIQWVVSAGLLIGYGRTLYLQLRQRMKAAA